MKIRRFGVMARIGASLSVACLTLLLSSCLITVKPYIGGNVTSNLGEDCADSCEYRVDAGESFSRTLTAEALPGNEFVRWSDSLGDLFSVCPQPTAEECTITITSLNPKLEGLELDVYAEFEAISGNIASVINILDLTFNFKGVIKQISTFEWLENWGDGPPVNYYIEQQRSAEKIIMFEPNSGITLTVDFANEIITSQEEGELPVDAKEILGVSGEVTAWLAACVSYGNAFGIYKGDYIKTGETTWVDRNRKSGADLFTYEETGRDDSSIYLSDATRNVKIQLNITEGMVYSSTDETPAASIAIVQRVKPDPINGRNADKVSYSDEAEGEVIGYFVYRGGTTWEEMAVGSDTPLATYDENVRSPDTIALIEQLDERKIELRLSEDRVVELLPPLLIPLPIYDIVAVE